LIDASATGKSRPAKAKVGHDEMWKELTGKDRAKGAKFPAHLIQHPVIRLWCKLIGHTYFARDEANNLTRLELDILYGEIGPKAIKYNVAHYVAKHFDKLARGELKDVMVGGTIDFSGIKFKKIVNVKPLTINLPYLKHLSCLKPRNTAVRRSKQFWWIVNRKETILLPLDGQARIGEIQINASKGHYLICQDNTPQGLLHKARLSTLPHSTTLRFELL